MPNADTPHKPLSNPPSLTWAGDRFLRIFFGDTATAETAGRIRAACIALRAAAIPGLLDLTPAYCTVLATFDALSIEPGTEEAVRAVLSGPMNTTEAGVARVIEIPVWYGGPHGEDLEALARAHDLTPSETVALHASAEYRVAFIGFTPGFPYLTGLPDRLATPRLPSPRLRVEAGSIGIAGSQTGIYPGGTPGGWRLIGRTPLRIFDPARERPALLAMGDRVRFRSITAAEFEALGNDREGR